MQFKIPPDGPSDGSMPGPGALGSPRTHGVGTMYKPADGPKGKGGGMGPNGTVNGHCGQRIQGFVGEPKGYEHAAPKMARDVSNPMKR